ncbi:acetyltransferase, GNAT family [Aeromicrobium marinum DSM 15272]|uniref:Acetyltransferase, GNAT family n=1 Tax=Aeromicrobium marinum DSM 15272 TaxID=585531 RepID=E2SFK4_9ACTN|nr:GNAT family N-acetyltransferase [Aeromicrobium marinum]EFQ82105.1 acetyltransferase, GNAT family [Aeromicrobium marinum DSM 15272]
MSIDPVDPAHPDAQQCLKAYFAELAVRFPGGFDAGVDDLDAFRGGRGLFLVARDDREPVACGALQSIAAGIDEVKRMWVDPRRRGTGLGGRMLRALEQQAVTRGRSVVRLDTHAVLTDAVAMYRRAGYVEIDRYNDNPYAQHWFEKRLGPAEGPPRP